MPESNAGPATVSSFAPSTRHRPGVTVRVSRIMPLWYSDATRVTAIVATITLAYGIADRAVATGSNTLRPVGPSAA
jgi:hypothetical protein